MGRTYQRVIDLINDEVPAKISRNAFCKKTGINVNSFDRYKAGISEPTTATLEKLGQYFNREVAWLRGEGTWPLDRKAIEKPFALCAECGHELQGSPEGFFQVMQDGTEIEGDGILRLYPCEHCLAAAKESGKKQK